MSKKRGNNEGSIYKRKNGSWRAQVTLDGQRLNYSAKTRKECQEWIRSVLVEIDDGMKYANTQLTVKEYLESWLLSKKASLKPATWTHYNKLARNYIIPALGNKKIRDLETNQIQSFYNQLVSNNVGAYTVRKIHTSLHSAMNHALKSNLINRNPASAAITPSEPNREMNFLDDDQVDQFLDAASGHRWEALYQLAISTGMRQMEILGLKWKDIDWRSKIIKVERQLVRPDLGEARFMPTKTKNGKRAIALGSKTISVMRNHQKSQMLDAEKAGSSWKKFGLIFTTSKGTPIHPRNLLRNFKTLLRDAGLSEIRFHDLRHTAASLMLNHGIPVIVVSRRLGHARPSITLDVYGHLMPTMQDEAARLMDELIFNKS